MSKGEGKISESKYHIIKGDKYQIEVTPEEHYSVTKFIVNGENKIKELKDNKYTIEDISEDYVVEVEFTKSFIDEFIENPKTGIKDLFLLVSLVLIIGYFAHKKVMKQSAFKKI